MPHIKDAEKVVIHETQKLEKEGHLCFVFAEGALEQYNAEPKWSTIHKIKRALKNPYHTEWSHQLVMKYAGSYDRQDIETASELAFLEFYRIVGARYEDGMILQNGNCFKGAKIPSLGDTVIEDGRHVPDEGLTIHEDGHVTIATAPEIPMVLPTPVVVEVKKRGRPAGSKNKVQTEVA